MKLVSFDVYLMFNAASIPLEPNHVVTCSPQEAFTIVSMPSFAGKVVKLVPNYEVVLNELPEMPEKED